MQRACGRALLGWALVAAAVAARADPAPGAPGVAWTFGPAAAALVRSQGVFGNPALLAGSETTELGLALGLDGSDAALARFDLGGATLGRRGFGIGYEAASSPFAITPARALRLAAAGAPFGPRVAFGGALALADPETGTAGWKVDLGAHGMPTRRLGVGLVAHEALRPRPAIDAARRLELAASWSAPLAASCSVTGLAGLEARAGAASTVWLGAQVAWRHGVEIAGAAGAGGWRFGVGFRHRLARLEVAAATRPATRALVSVHVPLGRTLPERRAAAALRTDTELAARLAREIAARQAAQLAEWLAEAAGAATRGAHEHAAALYRNVLLWSPESVPALAGLRRAQRGALLQEADSLVAAKDWWAATVKLEQASRVFPEDSLVTVRLQEVRGVLHRADRTRSEAAEQFRLGLDAYAAGRLSAATACFETALRLDPAQPFAAEFLERARGALAAQAQASLDRERETQERRLATTRRADEAAREDRSPAPVPAARLAAAYQRGMQMYRAGDLTAAMQAWEEVARLAPHYQEVERYLLRVYRVCGLESYTEGRLQQAIEIWAKALLLEPENPQVRRYLDQANAKLQRAQAPRGTR